MNLVNHYDYLRKHLAEILKANQLDPDAAYGVISAHGDKAYGYRILWEEQGIPFHHGVAIYLLSYFSPYSKEVRETENGWVDVKTWVINNYDRFKSTLP